MADNTTKKEYADVFNELFGTDIHWEKLPKEDLEKFAEVLAEPEKWIHKFSKGADRVNLDHVRELVSKVRKTVKDEVKEWHGPIISRLREFIKED